MQYPGSARDVDPDERSCRLEASGRPNSTLVNEAGLTRHFSRLCVKAAVLDTLLSHAAFLKQTGDEPGLAERERELLQARLSLPPGGESVAPAAQLPLHEATPPALLRLEELYNSELGEAARLTLRPLQYDLLDSNETRMPNAALEVGRTELAVSDESVRLRRLSLFHITNLHATSVPLTALPGGARHASATCLLRCLAASWPRRYS